MPFVVVGIALLLAQASAPAPSRVWVDAPPQLSCPDQGALLAALRFSLGKDRIATGKARPGEPSLSLRPSGTGGLTVVLRRAGTTLGERELHVAQDDCPALANTIALMAEAWLTAPAPPRPAPPVTDLRLTPSSQPTSPAPALIVAGSLPMPEASPEPSPATPDPAIMATPVANAPVASVEPAHVSSLSAPAVDPAAETSPEPATQPILSEIRETTASLGQASEAPVWSMTVSAALGGMAATSRPAAPVARVNADLRLDRRRWFFGIRGAAEDRADIDPSAGKLLVRHIPASATLGRVFGGGPIRLEVLVGAGVDVVLASTSAYGYERSFQSVVPLILAGVQAEWLVSRHFGIVAASEIVVDLQRDQFVVANVGPVARTQRVRAGFGLGGAWHLR